MRRLSIPSDLKALLKSTAWRIWTGFWIIVILIIFLGALFSNWGNGGLALLVLLTFAFYLLITMCVFLLPTKMVGTEADEIGPKDRLSLENDVRKALLQAVAGAALIGTFVYGWQQLNATRQQISDARENFGVQSMLITEQQRAERFGRAIDELSQPRTEGRLGGIATLVEIAESSNQQQSATSAQQNGRSRSQVQPIDYYEDVLGYLTGFLRSISRGEHPIYRGGTETLPVLAARLPEAQAAIDAIIKLKHDRKVTRYLDLSSVDLVGAQLQHEQLGGLSLTDADLEGADLTGADLASAVLSRADLRDANLTGVKGLRDAQLTGAIADRTTRTTADLRADGVRILSITIDKPAANEHVEQQVKVEGQMQDLDADAEVWVAVYVPKLQRYYPHDTPAKVDHNRWEISGVGIGAKNEGGQNFQLVAFMANPSAAQSFQEDNLAGRSMRGLLKDELPTGAVEMHRITVTRK